MSVQALLLLLFAAAIHAGWNFVLKRTRDRAAVFWWALALSSLFCLPALTAVGLPKAAAWPFVVGSAAAQAAYLALLSWAYSVGDFSLIYPIARGTAPLFLALWSCWLLHQAPSGTGLLGLIVLASGLIWLGMPARRLERSERHGLAVLLALLVALTISGYTVLDGAAVRLTSPLSYFLAEWCLSALLALPALLWKQGWSALRAAGWRERRSVVWIAGGSAGAYLLALEAYALSPVVYAGAVREISVVFATWLGWRVGEEKLGGRRLAASALVFLGVVLIGSHR